MLDIILFKIRRKDKSKSYYIRTPGVIFNLFKD